MHMKFLLQLILSFSIFSIFQEDVSAQISKRKIPVPNKAQLAWQQAEYGVIFHYDLHVFDSSKYSQTQNRITPIPEYNIFNPKELDVEQWVITAKESGAKFALLTATHETGFALFQSDVNPYSMKALKWKEGKGDIVKDFVEACRKHDIKPGIYLGIRWNSFLGVHNFVVDGEGEMQKARQKYYNAMVEGMVTEICTRYGPLFEIWFDGGADDPVNGAPDVLPIVKKYQPDCLFYHNNQLAEARWGGSESGKVGYPCWSTFPFPFTGSGESAPKEISKDQFYLLKHGETGKVVITTPINNALIIPQKATFELQDKIYVYVVDSNNIVHSRNIVVKQRLSNIYIVESGISKSDRILVEGIQLVKEDEKIIPKVISPDKILKDLQLIKQ